MQTVTSVIDRTVTSSGIAPSSTMQPSQRQSASCSEGVINQCIEKLKTIFTGWRATFKTAQEFEAYRKELVLAMIQFGVSSQTAVDRGITRARQEASNGREFLPSGSLFATWCKPTAGEYGIEPFYEAYEAVIFRQWEKIHPAFQHVCAPFIFDLKRPSETESKARFKELYDQVVKRVSSGEVFERIIAIEKPSPSGTRVFGREHGNSVLAGLLRTVGGKKSDAAPV